VKSLSLTAIQQKGLPIQKSEALVKTYDGWLRGLDLNQRPSGYEPERSILSLADSVALTLATGQKTLYSRPILCPSFAQVFPECAVDLAKSIRGVVSAFLPSCSLPLKNFPAFLLPGFPILGFAEIDAEFFGNLFKRHLGIVRSVVAEVWEHLDLLKIDVRGGRFWSSSHSRILPSTRKLKIVYFSQVVLR
jgi:hypothetical protein